MKTYEIKITGSGTKKDLKKELIELASQLNLENDWDDLEWENVNLFTKIDVEEK